MISLEHVTKKYGAVIALNDVSFQIPKGEIVGLLGRNGAGKTTALNLMTGYFPPDSGTVYVDGLDMLEYSRECKRRIGYLPEKPPLYDEMTVRDYLGFVSDLREVSGKVKKKHVNEILELCSLTDTTDRIIGHLSKGTRQRIGIAQALCGNPEVLILDEPTVGLDPVQVVEIRGLIRKLEKDHTILFSSHILQDVQQLCSTVLILHDGKLIRSFEVNRQNSSTIHMELSVFGREKEILVALRSIPCVRKAETLSETEDGTVRLRLNCVSRDERGLAADQIFHLMAALDAPIRSMIPEKNDLEETFLRAIRE